MPIEVTATDIEIPAPPIKLKANRLHVDRLVADSSGEVQSLNNPPSAEVLTRLYAEPSPNERTYCGTQERLFTRNLYAAAANVPKLAVALGAVFDGIAAWREEMIARRATEVAARKARDDAQTGLVDAQTRLSTANGAMMDATNAFHAAQNADTAGSTAETQAALAQATQAKNDAEQTVADAQQAVNDATTTLSDMSSRWGVAAAAAEDVANPKLEV